MIHENESIETESGWRDYCRQFLKLFFGVEWTLVLYTIGIGMFAPARQVFIYRKICMYHYNSDSLCDHIDTSPDLAEQEKVVQADYASYYTIYMVSHNVPSIVMTLIMGTWIDRFSFWLPLALPHIGSAVFIGSFIIFAYLPDDLVNPIYLGVLSVFVGLTGAMSTVISACNAYVSRTTSGNNRTVRLANIEASITVGSTIGYFLNAFLFAQLSPSHTFLVLVAIHLYAAVYVFAVIPELHTFEEVKEKVNRMANGSWFSFIFKPREDLLTAFYIFIAKSGEYVKYRPVRPYLIVFMLIFAMCSFTFGTQGALYDFLTLYPISFTAFQFALFSGANSVFVTLGLMFGMRLLRKFFNFTDAAYVVLGLASLIVGYALLGFGQLLPTVAPWVYGVTTLFSYYPFVAVRSGFTKIVNKKEHGRILSLLGLLENAFGLIGSVVVNAIYVPLLAPSFSSTVITAILRGYIFLLCAELFVPLFILSIWLGKQKIPNWSFNSPNSITL